MNNALLYTSLTVGITMLLVCCTLFSFNTNISSENSSPFECGFDSMGVSRVPFCMNFFLICIVFLVFDVEVSLILPLIHSQYVVIGFLFVLLVGLLYEWSYGGLQWII